jgi:two-component system, sensor histidine kinase and response regulator
VQARSLTALVIALFSATALLVGAIFTVLLVSVTNLRDADTVARRSSDLLAQAFADERSVVDMETGLRGFLLTRQPGLLQPYNQAQAQLPGELATLRSLARDGVEQRSIGEISVGTRRYIADYAKPLISTGGRLSASRQVQETLRGKQLLDVLRADFSAFDARVVSLSNQQRRTARSGASRAILVAGFGLGASIVLLLALGAYLLWHLLHPVRRVAKAAERLTGGDLDVRVPEGGHGEVARLGRSFNEMATAIQNRDRKLTEAQKQLERAVATAEDASAMKSNFLANMSHEIRTPLNGVLGMLSLVSETNLSNEQHEYIDAARASSDALMTVVSDVLDIAKIEAGRLEIERRDFDLHDMVEANCDMVAASALSKGVELQSFVHEGVPRAVRGDRVRVGQILANLLSNAVKFTAEGEVVVEVSVAQQIDEVIDVRFEVRDTGIGIAPERIDHLFEPFIQAEAGTTREYGGTGLGLAISLELTHLMRGTIAARSELGKGSTFRFEIPFAPARAELRAPVPAAELRGLRVLVVDDNPTNRRVFEAYVASWGMRPEVARDAPDALARLERAAQIGDPFDVALLDLNMPGESGLDLARTINASFVLRHTRLILLTSSEQLSAEASSAGISYRLSKPVRQSRLLDAISATMAIDVEPERALAQQDRSRAAVPHAPRARSRILVAEDQPVNWMLIERMLSKRGHTVANATDGNRVLELLESERYDLIFMDCQMRERDGYDTAREIRRREAATLNGHTTIVAMTANAMQGDRERCLAAGMDDYMAKPISSDALDQMLDRWLPGAYEDAAILDQSTLSELRSLFPGEEMSGMLRNIEEEVTADLERLDAALAQSDRVLLAAAAHRIKNSAQLIGAKALADAAAHLAVGADREEDPTGATDETAVEMIRVRWAATRTAIAAELAQA